MIPNQDTSDEQIETLRTRLAAAEDRRPATALHRVEDPSRTAPLQEGVVVLTERGDILYANVRFAALVGEPLESVFGSRIHRFIDASDRAAVDALLRARSGRQRCRLIGPDAGTFEVSLSLTAALSTGGDLLSLIVTDLRQLLEAANDRGRADRDDHTKAEFLATLAHELRTPLCAISNAVRVIEVTHACGESAARAHEVIARQVGHISRLIDDLLDIDRVISGKIRLNRQPLDMAEAVRQAVGTLAGDARGERQIDISTEPVWVDGDAVRLEQVLTNILTNAVKYTPNGGRIRVALRADGGDAVVTVEDTGVGIPPGLMPFIFDLYVQSERTLDRAQGGLGIGLTLARRLVELHGGTIVAWSEGEGRGSRFTVRLKQVAPVQQPSVIPFLPARPAKPRRVLLIEDSGDAREMLRTMLQLAGHEVYDAADGVRGLEMLNTVRPEVGIIDIGLPRLDGYQIARRIRKEPHGRNMLLLALTGYGSPAESKRSSESGFDYHLVKPVDLDHLTRLIGDGADARSVGRHSAQGISP